MATSSCVETEWWGRVAVTNAQKPDACNQVEGALSAKNVGDSNTVGEITGGSRFEPLEKSLINGCTKGRRGGGSSCCPRSSGGEKKRGHRLKRPHSTEREIPGLGPPVALGDDGDS